MDLSIVVVTYNCRDYLANCLSTVEANLPGDLAYEVLVVDNNSKDIDESDPCLQDPKVFFTKLRSNLGFPAANNLAFGKARGRHILMLNPDTALVDGNLPAMLRFLESRPDLGIVAPLLLNADGTVQESVQAFPTLRNSLFSIIPGSHAGRPYWNQEGPTEVDSVSGACMLFRASLLREIGGLDERLFWIEDVDLCYRVRGAGGGVAVYPGCRIVHYGGRSAKRNPKLSLYLQLTNRARFFMVHGRRNYGRIVYLATMISLVARFALYAARTLADGHFGRIATLRKISSMLARDRAYFFGSEGRAARGKGTATP